MPFETLIHTDDRKTLISFYTLSTFPHSTMTSTTSTILILLQLSSLILLTSTRRVPASTEQGGTQEESNEFVLDLKTVNGDPDNLMAQIKHLASALQTCGFSGEMQHMRLFQLTNQSVTCNDGTPAG